MLSRPSGGSRDGGGRTLEFRGDFDALRTLAAVRPAEVSTTLLEAPQRRCVSSARTAHPGLARGAMLLGASGEPHLFAFSRVERGEQVEYLVALNNSRTDTAAADLATCQPAGARLRVIFNSKSPDLPGGAALTAGADGRVAVSLAPLQCVVWQAEARLPTPGLPALHHPCRSGRRVGDGLRHGRSLAGHVIPERQELRADVSGGDGFAEVTFVMARASRPGQYELLGTDDAPPYRVFWRPPADLAPGDELTFIATVDDLRGHRASAEIDQVHVAPGSLSFGIRGAAVPTLTRQPGPLVSAKAGGDLTLSVSAKGTGPMEYRWLHDGIEIAGASRPALRLRKVTAESAGRYVALVHDAEGTAISAGTLVRIDPE